MSKLLEKLERVSRSKVQPMGFGAVAARSKTSPMVVVASLSKGTTSLTATEGGADAVLVSIGDLSTEADALGRVTKSVGATPWGVSLKKVTKDDIGRLVEMGCDFLVFTGTRTPSALLREQGLGKVLEIDPSLPDSLARAINRLPIDAVLIGGGMDEPSLTVERLMVCERLATLVRKPILVPLPSELVEGDLEALWDAEVRGLLVDFGEASPEGKLAKLRQAIEALPQRRKKPKEKLDAILPRFVEGSIPQPEEEEVEEPEGTFWKISLSQR